MPGQVCPRSGLRNHWEGALVARYCLRFRALESHQDAKAPIKVAFLEAMDMRLCFGGCAHIRSRVIQGRDLSTHSCGSIRACGCPRCQNGVEMDASNVTFSHRATLALHIDSTYIILITDFPLYLQQHLLLLHEIAFVLQGVLAKVRQLFNFCTSRCRAERRQT